MNTFNVGDWVINTTHGSKQWNINPEPFQLKDFNHMGTHIQPWQPKEGEWCWFWDGNIDASPLIGKYGYLSWTEQFYNVIEPFIGELPSFLKDK